MAISKRPAWYIGPGVWYTCNCVHDKYWFCFYILYICKRPARWYWYICHYDTLHTCTSVYNTWTEPCNPTQGTNTAHVSLYVRCRGQWRLSDTYSTHREFCSQYMTICKIMLHMQSTRATRGQWRLSDTYSTHRAAALPWNVPLLLVWPAKLFLHISKYFQISSNILGMCHCF